jgi:hypothetical protein
MLQRLNQERPSWLNDDDRTITLPEIGQSQLKDKWNTEFFDWIKADIERYNAIAATRQQLRELEKTSYLELNIAVFGPYVAAIALAVGLALIAFPPRP